jgi:hypothetical protein
MVCYGWICMYLVSILEPIFYSCKKSVMYGLLRASLLTNCCYRMRFFSRGNNGRNNRGRGNWNRGPRRPRFSIHFDVDPQELNQLFQVGFFNWIGHGIVHPRPERPPFQPQNIPGILVPPHVSLQPEVPANDGWKEIVNPLSLTIVVGPICHCLSHHLSIPMSIFPMLIHLFNLHMLVKD